MQDALKEGFPVKCVCLAKMSLDKRRLKKLIYNVDFIFFFSPLSRKHDFQV